MYCPKCGAIIKEGEKFCAYCGSSVQDMVDNSDNNSDNSYNLDDNSGSSFGSRSGSESGFKSGSSFGFGSEDSSSGKYSSSNEKTTHSSKDIKKNIQKKKTSKKRKCCYVAIILLIIYLIIGIPYIIQYNTNREDVAAFHSDEFNSLDSNGDGYLTFDEAEKLSNNISSSDLLGYFQKADHNGNDLLKGDEFDSFYYSVFNHFSKSLNSDKNKSNSNLKSTSSYKSSRTSPEHDLWRYEEIVDYDSYGDPIYVATYYTSGDSFFEPGVYTATGNNNIGWDYDFENSNWKSMYNH